jgi:hypothetical protein
MDTLTLNKMRELLEGAKAKIGQIEMKATPSNVNAAADAVNFVQIVINTIAVELSEHTNREKEDQTDGTKPDVQ